MDIWIYPCLGLNLYMLIQILIRYLILLEYLFGLFFMFGKGCRGSLPLRIEPRVLGPWDIFSCLLEYLLRLLRFVPFLLVLRI